MRAVVQRVSSSRVIIDHGVVGEIGRGLLVLLGVGRDDREEDVAYIVDKIAGLRVFEDAGGKMNLSLTDVEGSALVVSQFTLYGDVRRGKRPSFDGAAAPAEAARLYEKCVSGLRERGIPVATGRFQEMMRVEIVNEGPVTILLDSRKGF